MKIEMEKLLPYFVTLALLALSAVYKSALFGYASVLGLGVTLAKDIVAARVAALTVKVTVPDDVKRNLQDLNSRVVTIEHGIRTRGF